MKKTLIFSLLFCSAILAGAKDIQTLRVTTDPQMRCENCENRIKKSIRFEKGVQEIETNLKEQTITIVYDADKTSEATLLKAFDKLKYKARKLKNGEKVTLNVKLNQCDGNDKDCPNRK